MGEHIKFGDWLRQRRRALGIAQEELADRIGVSFAMLRKLESGERRPSAQIAQLLADYFRVPLDERDAFLAFARAGHASSAATYTGMETGEVGVLAPWRSTYARQTNLPVALTPLIGRDREVASAQDQLLNPKVRLLSMTGPPGIGKTRLALQVASNLVDRFEDGAFFVDLAPIVDPELVLPAVARTLQLREAADRPVESVLLDYVQERRMLLLLDNFEQVLDAAPQLVKLLQASPWLKVLLTSREALHIRGERVFSVLPLAIPDLRQPEPLHALASYSSVELFTERAQAVAPDFALAEENAEDVSAICIGLEGMPLAIELAAARANHFSTGELRGALGSRLKLLTGGGQDLPLRQRTLKGAVEWSYSLLSAEEQMLFRRLGVFVGGCALEAIEAVCGMRSPKDEVGEWWGGSGHSAPSSFVLRSPHVMEVLLSLVDKNLVRRTYAGSEGGETRFGMLEAIREYALAALHESGEAQKVTKAHALYFMGLVEEAEPVLSGHTGEGDWLVRIDAEHDNLLAALLWARTVSEKADEASEAEEVRLRMTAILWRFWYVRGYIREWEEHLAEALAFASPGGRLQRYRAKALTGAGTLAIWRGDYASARARFEESLAIRRELGDQSGVAAALNNLGVMVSMQGDHESARAFYEESLVIRRELGEDKAGTANLLHNLAELAGLEGDYTSARALYEESLALRREIGNKEGTAHALRELGLATYRLGDPTSARSLLEESLAIHRQIGDRMGMTGALSYLGSIVCDQGDYALARSLYEESLTIRREIGARVLIAGSLAELGYLAARTGAAARGARLLAACAALLEAMNRAPSSYSRRMYEEGLTLTKGQLTEATFAEAWAEGRSMPMEAAVSYALDLN